MGVSIPDWRGKLRAKVAKLTVHLRLHVERLLAARDPALVAGLHELADLVPERFVVHLRAEQRGHLGVHVEWRLAARLAARGLGLHELADLSLRLGTGGRGAGGRAAP